MPARPRRPIRPAATVVAAALLLGACASDEEPGPAAEPAPTGASVTTAPGFAPATPPPPAGTFTPSPGSWAGTEPAPGYRVALLTTDRDARTRVLSDAVRAWAGDTDVTLEEVAADDPAAYVESIQAAIDLDADLVVTTGDGLVDPMALVTASNLEQQFLVVGAELAEPTGNVTAADWDGASYRGEGLGQHAAFDPATFTPERADRALRAGVAAVLGGLNGTVVWVD